MNMFKKTYNILNVIQYVMLYVNVDITNLLPIGIFARVFVFRLTIYEKLVPSGCIVNGKMMWF